MTAASSSDGAWSPSSQRRARPPAVAAGDSSAARAVARPPAGVGGRMLGGAVNGGVPDAITQVATTGHVNLTGVAMAAGIGAVTAGRGCNSFTATTPVLMADGDDEPIADVRVGDQVVATDPT